MERGALRSTMPRSEMVVHTIYRILYAFHGERRTVLKFFTVVLRSTELYYGPFSPFGWHSIQ